MPGTVSRKRVVITGLGLVTPVGIGTETAWQAVCLGESGIAEITQFDASAFKTRIAGEVKDFHPADFLPRKEAQRTERFVAMAVAASRMAIEDAELSIISANAPRIGVLTGSGLGGLASLEKNHEILRTRGPQRVSPFFIPMMIGNMAAGMISILFGARGPNAAVATACAAGTHAVGEACHLILEGKADAMIAGGVDALITPTCVAGFNAMKAISQRNHEPQKASRPFDRDRDGFVLGEGSGMLVLEDGDIALQRGATAYAEICGYGMSGDGYHISAPSPDGEGAARCMQMAIASAGISPGEIDYVNAHGTGTTVNDVVETRALKTVFQQEVKNIPVSSTKSMTGHLLGGAGGVEAVFTALSLRDGIIPPTINLDNPDDECDLDYVPHQARRRNLAYAMTNSFGFGGTNASLVLKKINRD